MKAANWKVVAELLGIMAIVASLFFVGIEVRQNTAAVEASSIEGLTNVSHDFFMQLASDPELARIFSLGAEDMSKLTDSERSQVVWLQRSQILRSQAAYLQWKRGALGDEDWMFYGSFACTLDELDAWRAGNRGMSVSGFAEYVESC